MLLRDFVSTVEARTDLELVYSDPTMCILLCKSEGGERRIRLGLWAVRRMHWEQIVEAFHLPVQACA